jgi:hypothetical protein
MDFREFPSGLLGSSAEDARDRIAKAGLQPPPGSIEVILAEETEKPIGNALPRGLAVNDSSQRRRAAQNTRVAESSGSACVTAIRAAWARSLRAEGVARGMPILARAARASSISEIGGGSSAGASVPGGDEASFDRISAISFGASRSAKPAVWCSVPI